MNIGIVVLNYQTYEKTIDCVDSLLLQEEFGNNIKICIVDNGSLNESFSILKKKYSTYKNIYFTKINKNESFSRAMNEGVKKINSLFDSIDFLLLSNNDIVVKGKSLYEDIINSYNNKFGVMGPNIYSISTNSYSNPISKKPNNGLLYNLLSLIKSDIDIILRKWRKQVPNNEISNQNNMASQENCLLHGAFFIFSKIYLSYFPNGIYPQKSFYMEENILFFICQSYKIKTYYEPSIHVDHIHSMTINQCFDDDMKKKNKFVILQHRKSKKCLLNLIIKRKFGLKIKY